MGSSLVLSNEVPGSSTRSGNSKRNKTVHPIANKYPPLEKFIKWLLDLILSMDLKLDKKRVVFSKRMNDLEAAS